MSKPTFPNENLHLCPICGKTTEYVEIVERSYSFDDQGGIVLESETLGEVKDSWIECNQHGKWSLSDEQYTNLRWVQ